MVEPSLSTVCVGKIIKGVLYVRGVDAYGVKSEGSSGRAAPSRCQQAYGTDYFA